MRKSYVYKIRCLVTGEYYFGAAFRAKRDSYWGGGRKIRERIVQYGKENFVKEILGEFDDRTESHRIENQYIEKFIHDEKCLNIACDHKFVRYDEKSRAKNGAAHRGKIASDETRAKISAVTRGENNPMYGKIVSDNTRAKISAANLGKHRTTETRAKISAALRGKHRTAETRSKMSVAQRGKIVSDNTRAKISAALCGKFHGKHWRKNPVTGKREWYD